jgi:hypothetical protein
MRQSFDILILGCLVGSLLTAGRQDGFTTGAKRESTMIAIAVGEALFGLSPFIALIGLLEAVAETILISLLAERYIFRVPAWRGTSGSNTSRRSLPPD